MSLVTVEGSVTSTNSTVTMELPPDAQSVGIAIAGTWEGQIEFEVSVDGVTFANYPMIEITSGVPYWNTTENISVLGGVGGLRYIRVRFSTATSGTATVAMRGDSGTNIFSLYAAIFWWLFGGV